MVCTYCEKKCSTDQKETFEIRSPDTLAKTGLLNPKNAGAKVALNFI